MSTSLGDRRGNRRASMTGVSVTIRGHRLLFAYTKMPSRCVHAVLFLPCTASDARVGACFEERIAELRRDEHSTELKCLLACQRIWKEGRGRFYCKEANRGQRRSEEEQKEEPTVTLAEPPHDVIPSWTDFARVALDAATGRPLDVLAPPVYHSYYVARHASAPASFPLSTQTFANRRAVHAHGLQQCGLDPDAWVCNGLCAAWVYTDATTRARRVCALVVNERREPRWGEVYCPNEPAQGVEWQQDLVAHPVPVFLKTVASQVLRYCGHWSLNRITPHDDDTAFAYVLGTPKRNAVYRVSLAHYDVRWGSASPE